MRTAEQILNEVDSAAILYFCGSIDWHDFEFLMRKYNEELRKMNTSVK